MLHQLSTVEYAGRAMRMIPKRIMNPPTIQQFQAFPFADALYTQGETKSHIPARRHMVLAALAALNPPPVLTLMPLALICSLGVISLTFPKLLSQNLVKISARQHTFLNLPISLKAPAT
jgi:hypothetical protein